MKYGNEIIINTGEKQCGASRRGKNHPGYPYVMTKIVFDRILALLLIVLLAPVGMILYTIRIAGRRFSITGRKPAQNRRLEKFYDLYRSLCKILRGEMSFVGVRNVPSNPKFASCKIKPGLATLYGIRKNANIAHISGEETDAEYLRTATFLRDLGILARALISVLISSGSGKPSRTFSVLDIEIDNINMENAVDTITTAVEDRKKERFFFVNTDCLNKTVRNEEYKQHLKTAEHVYPDGIGIHYACRILGTRLRENVNGTDLLPHICSTASENGWRLYLVGAAPGCAEAAAKNISVKYPGITIAGTHHGYLSESEVQDVIDDIRQKKPDILLVAMGAPRQEKWICDHINELEAHVVMGVGGLFDFVSGRIPRAPLWIRELGLEWIFRMLCEPGRMWRRYIIGNPLFLWRVWRWKRSTGFVSSLKQSSPRLAQATAAEKILKPGLVSPSAKTAMKVLSLQFASGVFNSVKRLIDIVPGTVALVCFSPVCLVAAIAIKVEDRGPIFFRQTRAGRWGEEFDILKFRSMKHNGELLRDELAEQNEHDRVTFKVKNDPRITRVGHYIRKLSIDEIPQLVNVIKGDMTLVGPRPPLLSEVAEYTPEERRRLDVRPGITCIWQVSGRSDINFEGQVELDVEYIRDKSLLTDIKLLIKTIPAVITGRGAY